MSSQRRGRGSPIKRETWPESGSRRAWLVFCDKIHRANGLPSRRGVAEVMGLTSGTRVNDMLRGLSLPADEQQARDLLTALGAVGNEVGHGLALYKAARTEHGNNAARAERPGWWRLSGYIAQVGDIAPLRLLDRQDELDELVAWCADVDEEYVWWQADARAGKSALLSWFVLRACHDFGTYHIAAAVVFQATLCVVRRPFTVLPSAGCR